MRMSRALLSILMFVVAGPVMAAPTEIVVRVMAKDAKFIGTETGGARVTLQDAETGKILAEGLTTGATGSTPKIMTADRNRRGVLSDDTSAKFMATLDLAKPTRITVTAASPHEPAIAASATQWVLPGKNVNGGDGWVLELPGFAISLMEAPPAVVQRNGGAATVPVKAKITMQCGCPITPAGLWDASKLEVSAMLEAKGKTFAPTKLAYAGQPSTFAGDLKISDPGDYDVDLYAYDPANGNTGVVRFKVSVK